MARNGDWITEPCRNCGDTTAGRYCPACGQRKGDVRISLRRLLAEALEDQLSINSALPRTLALLFVQPGQLTAEYLRGRIARYVAPFRLYLVSSLLFFLVFSFANRIDTSQLEADLASARDSMAAAASDASGPRVRASTSRGIRFGVWVDPDSTGRIPQNWAEDVSVRTGMAQLDSVITRRLRQLSHLPPDEALNQVLSSTLQRAPTVMFLLLPVFALLLEGLYIRSGRFYVEHFIFALHYHAFAYVLFTLMLLAENTPIEPVLLIWMGLYLPIALRRVYGQGWMKTLFKWWTLGTVYMIIVGFGLVAALITGLVLL